MNANYQVVRVSSHGHGDDADYASIVKDGNPYHSLSMDEMQYIADRLNDGTIALPPRKPSRECEKLVAGFLHSKRPNWTFLGKEALDDMIPIRKIQAINGIVDATIKSEGGMK